MSGSYSDLYNKNYQMFSGSVISSHEIYHQYGAINADALWENMYVKPKPVIIVCGYCKSHNAVTNPTCIQCGAPMGYGIERIYG